MEVLEKAQPAKSHTGTNPKVYSDDEDSAGPAQRARSKSVGWWSRPELRTPIVSILIPYLLLRATCLIALLAWPSRLSATHRLLAWDATWYTAIASHGYPDRVPQTGFSELAFFPAFPVLIRLLHDCLGSSAPVSAMVLSVVFGASACYGVYWICCRLLDPEAAVWTAICFAVAPQSFLFNFGYTEGLFVTLVCVSFAGAMNGRWATSALAALMTGFVRPTAIVLCAVGVAALVRARPKSLREATGPLILIVFAPLGELATIAFLGIHAHNAHAWFLAEQRGWHSGFDGGLGALVFIAHAVVYPAMYPGYSLVAVVIVTALWQLRALKREATPVLLRTYSAGVILLALTSGLGVMSSFPRLIFVAFPLFVPLGRRLASGSRRMRCAVIGVSALLACAMTVLAGTTTLYVP